ncbi:hypothetical protein T4D_10939, partial [Trichinella pseudospiralis]
MQTSCNIQKNCNTYIIICKRFDKAIVTMASNYLTQHLIRAAQKKHIKIRVPVILRWNNASMGGVDTLDKLLSSYRPLLRSIKW